jgi:hypothetical protein
LIRFDRTDHHPVAFAFVADRNPLIPTSTARSATTAKRRLPVFGGTAQIPVIRWRLGERAKSTYLQTLPLVQKSAAR